jgi:hypothetical protein
MTSHYARCSVKGSFDSVLDAVSVTFGSIYVRRLGRLDGLAKAIVLGEHYFFRTGGDAAVLIVVEERSQTDTRVEIISWAGGEGMFSISKCAHSSYVQDVINALADSGFELAVEEEISYFDRSKTPTV